MKNWLLGSFAAELLRRVLLAAAYGRLTPIRTGYGSWSWDVKSQRVLDLFEAYNEYVFDAALSKRRARRARRVALRARRAALRYDWLTLREEGDIKPLLLNLRLMLAIGNLAKARRAVAKEIGNCGAYYPEVVEILGSDYVERQLYVVVESKVLYGLDYVGPVADHLMLAAYDM